MAFEIEKGILKPRSDRAKYPWSGMEVGDSFFVPDGDIGKISSIASNAGSSNGKKFSTARIKDDAGNFLGVRVWRDA